MSILSTKLPDLSKYYSKEIADWMSWPENSKILPLKKLKRLLKQKKVRVKLR